MSTRILIVDDEPAVARGIARLLNSYGYRSDWVTSAAAALQSSVHNRFSLVITDLMMPGVSGLELIDRMAPASPETKFALLTGADELDLVQGCRHTPSVISVMRKPWDEDELLAAVRQVDAPVADQTSRHHTPTSCTALLIEDNDGDGALICEYLADAGDYRIERATRLHDAVELLQHHSVDIVITDLSLPDAAGLDCVRRLARQTPGSPLIVLSGLESEDLALQAVQSGAQDYLVKGRIDGQLLHRAIRYARERKRAEMELTRLAHHDLLTGLANRIAFRDHAERLLSRAKRHRSQFALLYIDLDGFKPVNDQFGHHVGDAILIEVAHRLGQCVRPSDVVARLGGDEFAILVEDTHGATSATTVASRILDRLNEPYARGEQTLPIAASVGIAFYPTAAEDLAGLLSAADEAMYCAKRRGEHGFVVHPGTEQKLHH